MTSAFLYTTELIVRPGTDTDNVPIVDISTLESGQNQPHFLFLKS